MEFNNPRNFSTPQALAASVYDEIRDLGYEQMATAMIPPKNGLSRMYKAVDEMFRTYEKEHNGGREKTKIHENFEAMLQKMLAKKSRTVEDDENLGDMYEMILKTINNQMVNSKLRKRKFREQVVQRARCLQKLKRDSSALANYDLLAQTAALNNRTILWSVIEEYCTLLTKAGRYQNALSLIDSEMTSPILEKSERKKLRKLRESLKSLKQNSLVGAFKNPTAYDPVSKMHDFMILSKRAPMKKWSLHALNSIEADTTLLNELPVVFALGEDARQTHCAECARECLDYLVPCRECSEAVFCSINCRESGQWHTDECGYVHFLGSEISLQAHQVFRVLSMIGVDSFMDEKTDPEMTGHVYDVSKTLESEYQQGSRSTHQATVKAWYQSQKLLCERLINFKPRRTAKEMLQAFMVLSVYQRKNPTDMALTREDYISLLERVAVEIARTHCYEYTWSMPNSATKSKTRVLNYQVTIAQNLSPSCVPNARWDFDGHRFILQSSRPIVNGEEITIYYGNNRNSPFFQRQEQANAFLASCTCEVCQKESHENFALSCKNCYGPVPYDRKEYPNKVCMTCNEKAVFENNDRVRKLQELYENLDKITSILNIPDDCITAEDFKETEQTLEYLYRHIDLKNVHFQKAVWELILAHIRRDANLEGVEWFYRFYEKGLDLAEQRNTPSLEKILNRMKIATSTMEAILSNPTLQDGRLLYSMALALVNRAQSIKFSSIFFSSEQTEKFFKNYYESAAAYIMVMEQFIDQIFFPQDVETNPEYESEIERENITHLIEPIDALPMSGKMFGYSLNENNLLNTVLKRSQNQEFVKEESESNTEESGEEEESEKTASIREDRWTILKDLARKKQQQPEQQQQQPQQQLQKQIPQESEEYSDYSGSFHSSQINTSSLERQMQEDNDEDATLNDASFDSEGTFMGSWTDSEFRDDFDNFTLSLLTESIAESISNDEEEAVESQAFQTPELSQTEASDDVSLYHSAEDTNDQQVDLIEEDKQIKPRDDAQVSSIGEEDALEQ